MAEEGEGGGGGGSREERGGAMAIRGLLLLPLDCSSSCSCVLSCCVYNGAYDCVCVCERGLLDVDK